MLLGYSKRSSSTVYLPHTQRRRILADKAFDLIQPFGHARIFVEELAASPSRFVMLFRESMAQELEAFTRQAATLIYSMWPGYLDRGQSRLRSWCENTRTRLAICHTSGHADPQTLVRFAQALRPRHIVPIHTEVPDRFRELFANTVLIDDTWLDV